jgi:hypothetical protein
MSDIAYRTPACDKHLPNNENDVCPWCRIAELEAKLEAVRQVSRYPSGAFGEAPSGEYASEDGEFMFSEDVLAALEDDDA